MGDPGSQSDASSALVLSATPNEIPLGFLVVALVFALSEYVWRKRNGRGYDLAALGGHLGIVLGNGVARVLTGGLIAVVLLGSYSFAPVQWSLEDWRTWAVGLLVLEFFYYWQHRFSHTIRWVWASHSVHHSTNEFTLPAAFRLSWFSTFSLSWLVYVPMTLMGFHPVLIFVLLQINLRYQYFLHTESVGKLGPLEWVFNTPSHHRAHHGSNSEYLDKNYGGVLIIFDRLFGTFAEEREDIPVVYGLTKKLESNNPLIVVTYEWRNLFSDAWRARSARDLARALFGSPSDLTASSSASTDHDAIGVPVLTEPSRRV